MSGETPNLGLPYPELTDTADVPRDIKALADELDALLGGGSGGGPGAGTVPLVAAPVLVPGMVGQIRAGRQLTAADFTALGLSAPIGLWNLGGLTNLGSDGRPLVNLGAVPFGVGINGAAASAAVFAGSSGQALYTVDAGAADPYRIRTGSWGCWFRTAKRGTQAAMLSKWGVAPNLGWLLQVLAGNQLGAYLSVTGSDSYGVVSATDVCDDRWHFGVATYDGTAFRLYVDGVADGSPAAATGPAGAIFPGPTALNVGAFNADASTAAAFSHYGRVDEAFVTADVLTEDQIRCLYATRLAHTLGTAPGAARMSVHRRRKGPALAVADFTTQPVRLHNFTNLALTDQGSGGVPLTITGGNDVGAGADGTPRGAFTFNAGGSLQATDAGLPGGLTARSYGCWFKTTATAAPGGLVGWGTLAAAHVFVYVATGGVLQADSGGDAMPASGPPFVADGAWHQAVVVEDNTAEAGIKRKLYLDGRLVGSSTVLNTLTLAGANKFRVGANPNGTSPFIGQIDSVFVCNYALTHAEIMGLGTKGAQDLGASPKNEGAHIERVDASAVLFVADGLESQHLVDLGVTA